MLMRRSTAVAAAGLALLYAGDSRIVPPKASGAAARRNGVHLSENLPASVHAYRMTLTIRHESPVKTVYFGSNCWSVLMVKPNPDIDYPILQVRAQSDR